jgi:hypothetical protein
MLFSITDLSAFGATDDLADQAHALLEQQKQSWDQCRRGYETLATVRSRTFDLDGSRIIAQFNPGRIASSTAKTDAKSIAERKCFLCPANLPAEQRALEVPPDPNYLILVNPFPIFPEHFTIPHRDHTPQRIVDTFPTMLSLAKALASRYTVFYNGPKCGASAPDHLHFQAGTRGFMPMDDGAECELLYQRNILLTYRSKPAATRRFLVWQAAGRDILQDVLEGFIQVHARIAAVSNEEPMMNILAEFHPRAGLIVTVFPRSKHRPSFYYAEGSDRLLLSPAAVEMGGVCTLPIEADFDRLTRDHLAQMYNEVGLENDVFDALCGELKRWCEDHTFGPRPDVPD